MSVVEWAAVLGGAGSFLGGVVAVVTLPLIVWQIIESRRFQAAQLVVSEMAFLPPLITKFREGVLELDPQFMPGEWSAKGFPTLETLSEISRHLHVAATADRFAHGFADESTVRLVLDEMTESLNTIDRLQKKMKAFEPGEPLEHEDGPIHVRDVVVVNLLVNCEINRRRALYLLKEGPRE